MITFFPIIPQCLVIFGLKVYTILNKIPFLPVRFGALKWKTVQKWTENEFYGMFKLSEIEVKTNIAFFNKLGNTLQILETYLSLTIDHN